MRLVRPRWRLALCSSCTAALALAFVPVAFAAGSGYGGTTPSPSAPPTGFSSIVTAKTLGVHGGSVKGKVARGHVTVTVPKGAFRTSLQVAITGGSSSTVKKNLPSALAKDRVVAQFGVELESGTSPATTTKDVTVTFSSKNIAKGDIVVVYDQATGKFVKANATVKAGQVTVHLKAGESIAILAPPHKK